MQIVFDSTAAPTERAAWREALCAAMPAARIVDVAQVADPEAIAFAVVANPAPGALRGLPRLRLIQSLWAGVDRLVADPTVPAEVPIARMVDPAMTAAMAQSALWATLALHRGFFDYAHQQRARVWRQRPQRRAQDVRVVVLGFGEMGRAVAGALAQQGYRVGAWRARASGSGGADADADADAVAGVVPEAGAQALPGLLADADVVVNLLPLTPATTGLLDARFFGYLPEGAAIVNFARGAHVVERDLLAALDAGRVGRAVLDVFATEPLAAAHPFWTHPNVTVLPHVAALTDMRSAVAVVRANLEAVARGEAASNLVDRRRGY
ncbi:MAG: 2-hydroxyacid dehydrogenase [Lautropia sp.]